MDDLFLWLALMAVSAVAVWKGGAMLETSAEVLARHHRVPPVVQGSVITAVGSSFPELSTAVVSTLLHGEFDLGISVIVGSAIFNVLVIPGVAVLRAGELQADRILVYKDAQFYLISVSVLLLVFSMAVIHAPVPGPGLKGTITRPVAMIPIVLYVLYIFLQHQETRDFQRNGEPTGERERRRDAGHTSGTTARSGTTPVRRQWVRLTISLVLIVASVEGLVRGAIFLGNHFGTPSFLWGVTVLALVTSLPDAVVSVRGAVAGRGKVSLANVLGSNVFDLLVAVPLGVLIAGSSVVDFSVAVPMMLFLTFATILLFVFLRLGLKLQRTEGTILLLTYILFVGWIALETTGLTGFLRTAP